MFNHDEVDDVCVQAIHVELGGRPFKFSQKPSRQLEIKDFKDSKRKGSLKGKRLAITQKEGARPACTHCQWIGHDESKCWKIYPELRPKMFQKKNGEKKANAAIQQDLGCDSSDEVK